MNVYEKLNSLAKKESKNKLSSEKAQREMKECTFIPKINKKDLFHKKRLSNSMIIQSKNFSNA